MQARLDERATRFCRAVNAFTNRLHACFGDMLLEALVACAGVTLKAVATALELDVH